MKYLSIDNDGQASQLDKLKTEDLQAVLDGDAAIYKMVGDQFWWLEVNEPEDDDRVDEPGDLFQEWHKV